MESRVTMSNLDLNLRLATAENDLLLSRRANDIMKAEMDNLRARNLALEAKISEMQALRQEE
jgi:hypothetical protein